MQYIIICDLDIRVLVENVNNAIQQGWEPLGGVSAAMEPTTVRVPIPSEGGIGLQSLKTREIPAGMQTLYIQAMIKR